MGTDPEALITVARVRETTASLMAKLEANSQHLQALFQTPPTGQGQSDSMILGVILELQKGNSCYHKQSSRWMRASKALRWR